MPGHINLTVAEPSRSLAFYQCWFGFSEETRTFPDGTVFTRDDEGTDLAFHAGPPGYSPPAGIHFGFRLRVPEAVRTLGAALEQAGVEIVERDDEPQLVSVKFLDPDGYQVEVYWEPG